MVEQDGRVPGVPARGARLPREIYVLVGASFAIAIGFGLVAPVLPAFVRSFDVGITAASAVISVFALSRLLFAPMAGSVVSRFGELPVFVWGLAVVAATTGGLAFATAYWQLIALRLIAGVGSTMFTISAVSLLVRLSPAAQRGRATSLWATGFLLGNIAGPLLGGTLAAIDIRAPFLIYAGLLVLVLTVGGRMLRSPDGPVPEEAAPSARFRDVLPNRAYRAALVGNFANGWAVFGVRIALVPLVVVESLGREDAFGGIALAVFAAGNALTLLPGGRIADRLGRRPPLITGLAVSGAATALLGYTASPWLFLVLSLVAGLGSGLLNPPLNAAVADVIGERGRGGSVLAGFQMSADLGAISGPLIAGALAEGVGYGPAFALTGVLSLAAALVWWRAPETLPGRGAAAR
ncbi:MULTISPECIES: MFS transporter [Pseudonocardia]|uniref:Tetracycline resistance protein, class B n=2 Tax=Pseudonocardia TaxID=1847 RepID=A0A1Y2MSG9_PSEAH|nr:MULTISPECIES: MFS transporter [Pseudonocardia]OSY38162.1 Tetracycline resistance protein, class B [Pseudonocardia autotrophica]TDN75602.1 putative MFS family arabinose efflux permease [Pseudonocardia autotrophica]BBF99573.1 MFS transporter [Pseudonocardia autotrophica]GEC27812.1 MFS transporter [Pseudonocardia saturnea]